jgi:adenylyltransferase/sulfurtransferase
MSSPPTGRYSRQTILTGFGEERQRLLQHASALVVGAGGLGVPALQYLAAAGVGKLGIVDGDRISLSNLHRQVIYPTDSVGERKTDVAVRVLQALNPEIHIEASPFFMDQSNALGLIAPYSLVIDATDNFASRYLLSDACEVCNKPLIQGSVSRFEGQLLVFGEQDGKRSGYRDLFPQMIADDEVAACGEAGVLGVLPGIIGTMQAAEALRLITGIGEPLINQMLTFNLLKNEWNRFALPVRTYAPLSENEFLKRTYPAPPHCDSGYTDIGPAEFDDLIGKPGITIIDVRERGEQPQVGGFDHLVIPMSELPSHVAGFHGKTLVLFCHWGIRSAAAAALFPAGNRIFNLKGGIVKWLHASRTNSAR